MAVTGSKKKILSFTIAKRVYVSNMLNSDKLHEVENLIFWKDN